MPIDPVLPHDLDDIYGPGAEDALPSTEIICKSCNRPYYGKFISAVSSCIHCGGELRHANRFDFMSKSEMAEALAELEERINDLEGNQS